MQAARALRLPSSTDTDADTDTDAHKDNPDTNTDTETHNDDPDTDAHYDEPDTDTDDPDTNAYNDDPAGTVQRPHHHHRWGHLFRLLPVQLSGHPGGRREDHATGDVEPRPCHRQGQRRR